MVGERKEIYGRVGVSQQWCSRTRHNRFATLISDPLCCILRVHIRAISLGVVGGRIRICRSVHVCVLPSLVIAGERSWEDTDVIGMIQAVLFTKIMLHRECKR